MESVGLTEGIIQGRDIRSLQNTVVETKTAKITVFRHSMTMSVMIGKKKNKKNLQRSLKTGFFFWGFFYRKGDLIMGNFTFEEMNLMYIYNTGSRTGLIDALTEMCGELSPEEAELRELTDSALMKLRAMTDDEFVQLELYPDFDE